MDNIINFPTWVIEKERELSALEFELYTRQQKLQLEEKKIKQERRLMGTRMLLSFCIGLLAMGCVVLPLL